MANVCLMPLFKEMKNSIWYSRRISDESGVSNFLRIVLNVNFSETIKNDRRDRLVKKLQIAKKTGGLTHG